MARTFGNADHYIAFRQEIYEAWDAQSASAKMAGNALGDALTLATAAMQKAMTGDLDAALPLAREAEGLFVG